MLRKFNLLVFVSLAFGGLGQIEVIPKESNSEKKDQLLKEDKTHTTEIYFVSNWSRTNRALTENEGLFADSVGKRADETYLDRWSFALGMKNRINPFLEWEGGISFLRNGESYLFEGSDTSHQYTSSYAYIGMPVKISFVYGNSFQFFASAGVIPQMFLRYSQDQKWVTSNNTEIEEPFKTSSGYNPFVLSAVFNVGGKMAIGKRWAVIVSPEYRHQVNSSFVKNSPYIHKARALGVTFGLTFKL